MKALAKLLCALGLHPEPEGLRGRYCAFWECSRCRRWVPGTQLRHR